MRIEVPDHLDRQRVDKVVAVLTGLSRAAVGQMIEAGRVSIEGEPVPGRRRVPAGALLQVDLPEPEEGLVAEPVPFTVLFEDDHLLVVDKPSGIVVHPGAGTQGGTLAAGLAHRYPELAHLGERRSGLVHRLDRSTSGLLLVARSQAVLTALQKEMRARRIERRYLALVAGVPDLDLGTIEAPIGPDPRRPTRRAVVQGGRPARTHYRVLAAWPDARRALLEVRLETGRTHQIRVHLASIGYPVVGDRAYGDRSYPRVWLHAAALAFTHPVTAADHEVRSPLPSELTASLEALGTPTRGRVAADLWGG